MGLRLIELQHALPKTQDIGKMQEHMNQRPNVDQGFMMSEMEQLQIEKRKKAEKLNKSELQGQNTTKTPKNKKPKDPRKGQFVDLEL